MQDWARRLLALETVNGFAADVYDGLRVVEKLRISLIRFVGEDGFSALLRRALSLARADAPSLGVVIATKEGRLEGLEKLATDEAKEAATAITAHLLGLLVTFIGRPLTLRLMRDAWPDTTSRTTGEFEDS